MKCFSVGFIYVREMSCRLDPMCLLCCLLQSSNMEKGNVVNVGPLPKCSCRRMSPSVLIILHVILLLKVNWLSQLKTNTNRSMQSLT